jgi:hypothetical protein
VSLSPLRHQRVLKLRERQADSGWSKRTEHGLEAVDVFSGTALADLGLPISLAYA